jgi:hypothetical protein
MVFSYFSKDRHITSQKPFFISKLLVSPGYCRESRIAMFLEAGENRFKIDEYQGPKHSRNH